MNAKEACEIAKSDKKYEIIFKRFFGDVKAAASGGQTYLYYCGDSFYTYLPDDQFDYLRKLGYKVTKGQYEKYVNTYVVFEEVEQTSKILKFFGIKKWERNTKFQTQLAPDITTEFCCEEK